MAFHGGALRLTVCDGTGAMTCPKCASSNSRSVEDLLSECRALSSESQQSLSELLQQCAPPGPRHPALWLTFSATFAVVAALTFSTSHTATLAFLTCCALATLMARNSIRYNRLDLPRLAEYWHRAFICKQCGEVFVPPGQ